MEVESSDRGGISTSDGESQVIFFLVLLVGEGGRARQTFGVYIFVCVCVDFGTYNRHYSTAPHLRATSPPGSESIGWGGAALSAGFCSVSWIR